MLKSNSELPPDVRATMPAEGTQTIFRCALNQYSGLGEMLSCVKAYRTLEDSGVELREGQWVEKDSPAVGDVHVNRPLGSDQPKKKPRKAPATDDATTVPVPLDKQDVVSMDVPLLLRLLEMAREDITDDASLHTMVERLTAAMAGKDALDMSDYGAIAGTADDADKKDDPGTEDADLGEMTPPGEGDEETDSNGIAKRISGVSQIPLNAKGEKLAADLGKRIAALGGLDILYCSDLRRAIQTADAIEQSDAEEGSGSMYRVDPTSDLEPWRFWAIQGKSTSDVSDLITHYIEHPDEVPPGAGPKGQPSESFADAAKRQIGKLRNIYADYQSEPTLKIGVVMHSRGMELLRAYVDAGSPTNVDDLDTKDLLHPDDPEHASMLRWADKIKPWDVSEDEPLKGGVYLILHSLTDDDTDPGNEELEKRAAAAPAKFPPWIAVDLDKTLAEPLSGDYDPGRIGEPIPSMVSKVKEWLKQGKAVKIFTARVAHDPDGKARAAIEDWCEKNIGQKLPVTNEKDSGTTEIHDDIAHPPPVVAKQFVPPTEVQQAAKLANDAGTAVIDITAPLAEGAGMGEDAIRKIAAHFADSNSVTEPAMSRDAWGGKDAAKWAVRVIRKIDGAPKSGAEETSICKAGNGVMLAFWPPKDVAEKLAVPGGEAADDLHLTLAYFGKLDEVPMESLAAIERAVNAFADSHGPVPVKLAGLGRFPATPQSDGEDVVYLGVHSPGILKFREGLVAAVEAAGVQPKKTFSYTPHVTLKLLPQNAPHFVPNVQPVDLTFDRIVLSIGTATKEYALAVANKAAADDAVNKSDKGAPTDFEITADIVKLDSSQHVVFGWFSVVEVEGRELVDTQGDIITPETIEASAYEFVLNARTGGEMHEQRGGEVRGVGRLVESVVFTKEKVAAMVTSLHIQKIEAVMDLRCVAWWGGMKIDDEDTWAKITTGQLLAWSIGGSGKRPDPFPGVG